MTDYQHFPRIQVTHRVLQQEAQRTDVGPPPIRVVIPDEGYFVRKEQAETQFLELVVHQRGQRRVTLPGLGVRDDRIFLTRQVQQMGPGDHAVVLVIVGAMNLDHNAQSYEILRTCAMPTVVQGMGHHRQKTG